MVATLLAWNQRMQGFDRSHSYLFWGAQILFAVGIIMALCYAWRHWETRYHISKKRLVLSIVNIFCLYVMAWIYSEYSWLLILLGSMTDMCSLRRCYYDS